MGKVLIIPDINNIEDSCNLADKWNAGFEYNDFFLPAILDNDSEINRIVNIYKSLDRDRSRDTLHGAFFDITVHSDDPDIVRVSEKRVRKSMAIATNLGVSGVVFHTNHIANFRLPIYINNFVERNAYFWSKIIEEYPGLNVYIENMFDSDYTPLLSLAECMCDNAHFGVCLDYAHLAVFGDGRYEEWVSALAPYIKHMHINDNDLQVDMHSPVGEGMIDWDVYNKLINTYKVDTSILVEVNGTNKQRKSLEYLRDKRLFPYS